MRPGQSRLAQLLVVALLIAALAVLSGCSAKASAEILGYRTGQGNNEITVLDGAGPGDEASPVEVLTQDATSVKVRVMVRRSAEMQDAILLRKELVATLDAPLGDRLVVDEAGAEVPRQP